MKMCLSIFVVISLFHCIIAAPQNPEINDQFEIETTTQKVEENEIIEVENITDIQVVHANKRKVLGPQESIIIKLYNFVVEPIMKIVNTPKVRYILRNVGTCIVNGFMELISYYLPAPIIPLIASAAGLVIPFEPIVLLKERMPVTSYKRAFQTAIRTFLNTFQKFNIDEEFDPYMTRRFNRRFMGDIKD